MSVDQFLKQRAINIAVGGSYSLPNWFDPQGKPRKFACRTYRMSPFRMLIDAPVVGKIGDQVTSFFGDFGKLNGHISDTKTGGLLLELAISHADRQTLAGKLTWLENKQKDPKARDRRQNARIIPENAHSTVTLADGSIHSCFVVNMSTSGVLISAEMLPPVGTPLAVGACIGRVVRHLDLGFAVKFVDQQKLDRLEQFVIRPLPLLSRSSTNVSGPLRKMA